MINKVIANNINTIFYIGNKEQYVESCKYLNDNKFVWIEDGFYYYRNPINFPFLIFADCNKTMMVTKIFDEYKKEKFYKILIRRQKLERILF